MARGVPELRRALIQIGVALDGDLGKLAYALTGFDVPQAMRYITDAYPDVLTPYLAASGDLTATWYEAQPAAIGAKSFTALPAELPAVEQLAVNGRWALTQKAPASALQGAGKRQLFQQHRDTVLDNAGRERVSWAREARPGACGFCRMLATRVLTEGAGGAPGLYGSKRSAGRNAHQRNAKGHDFCRCIAVPLRGGEPYTVPGYVHDWLDDYEAVARDADGRLLPQWKIAARMEARAAERGELFSIGTESKPAIIDLDAGAGRRKAGKSAPTPESKADVASRLLPTLEANLKRLRDAGHSEDSGPVEYHIQQIARLRRDLASSREPLALTAAPRTPAVSPPGPGAIAEWLDAEDAHWAAVEYWRRVDAENLHALPPGQAILENPPAETPPASGPPIDIPNDPAPVSSVAAVDRAGETELDRTVREFEEAVASGDDARIEAAAAAMDAAEQAEAKAAEQAAKRAARAEAIADAEQDRILAAVEAGTDPVEAEADVLIDRPSQQRKIRDLVKSGSSEEFATSSVYAQIVERIRRRDFMAQARADGHSGKGFDDLLDSVFLRRVEEIYIEAENACRGQMVTRKFVGKFDPKRFWYVNDATARKYMSDELAEWFDQNGRLTRPVMRQMILDGETSFDRYTAMRADYLQ